MLTYNRSSPMHYKHNPPLNSQGKKRKEEKGRDKAKKKETKKEDIALHP